jgi:hypothetical protein
MPVLVAAFEAFSTVIVPIISEFRGMCINPPRDSRQAGLFQQLALLAVFLALVNSGCASGNAGQTTDPVSSPSAMPSPTAPAKIETYIPDRFGQPVGRLINTYVNDETISAMGYEIMKSTRAGKSRQPNGMAIEYAVLRHNGRVVATFDSQIDQLSEVRFGFFSFLGDRTQQVVIEQTSDRFWRYWIVRLQPQFKIIYDSGTYDVVFELRVHDFDGDGKLEVLQNLGSFQYFKSDNIFSPRPQIVFHYDSRKTRYAAANPQFKEVALKDIGLRVTKALEVIEQRDDSAYELHVRSAVLDVVLRFLYCGDEDEAWAFYDQHYSLPDKESFRFELKQKLERDKVYREISGQTLAN